MVQDGKPADDKRNSSSGKLSHQLVPVRVLPVQHGEIHPPAAGGMESLQLARYPARLFLFIGELGDANLFAFRPLRAQEFLGKVRANSVLPDHLRGHAQNVWSRAVILRQADAISSGVISRLPPGEFFQKKLKAGERSAAKAVDGL